MKLRRIFPAAAVCFSIGIAVAAAAEPADEDSRRELIYSFGELAASAGDDNAVTGTMLRYAGTSDPETGWSDKVAYQNDGSTETADDALRDYDFSIPFDESVTDRIGVVGYMNDDGELVSSPGSTAAANNTPPDKASYSILYFEKKAYRNAPDMTKIMSERSLSENPEDNEEEELLIAPLSAPFSLLVMILGFGIVVVTYTSRTKD